MSKQIRWLYQEIASWQSEQLISDQQAQQIRARYEIVEKSRSWDRLIFPSIGAIVFGLGVILFFAYNWADMHKYMKLAVVFGSVLTAHGLGYYFTKPDQPQSGFGEGMHLLGTMLFGAGIWLIAQIYHLDEHYPNAFLVWGLGALAFAWVLPSIAQGLLAVAIFSLWSGMEIIDFRQEYHVGWLFILVGLIPLAWMLRSRALLFFSLLAFSFLFTYNLGISKSVLIIYVPFYLVCLYMALAKLVQATRFPESASVLHFVGFVSYLLFLYLFSFKFYGRFSSEYDDIHWLSSWVYCLVPVLLTLGAWLAVLFGKSWQQMNILLRWQSMLIVFVMLLVALILWAPFQFYWLYALLFNLIFMAHCVILIIQGIQQLSWKQVSIGCLMMVALLFARFTDLFGNLLVRSLVFVLLGAGLFAVGYFYSRNKPQEMTNA